MHQRGQKILIVDDERLNIRVLDEMLRDTYEVSVALSGEEALEVVRIVVPDLILLDIQMPGMDGYEVCRRLMADEATRSVPIVFVTAMHEKDDEQRGLELGAVDYITKPFHPAIILSRLKNHLKLQQLNRQLKQQVEQEVALRMTAQQEHELSRQLLIQQSKMAEMGSMLGAIAHQWQQPLCTVSILTESVLCAHQNKLLDEAYLKETTESVLQQIRFMAKTVEDFRRFLVPSKEKVVFNLLTSVQEIIALIGKEFELRDIALDVHCPRKVRVIGYPNEVKQVVLNLLNNARDALSERKCTDPRVSVTIEAIASSARVMVCDNGGGISEDLLPEKLFDPFETTKGEKGTGIGLSLAKQIITRMDGTIAATNTHEGACFILTLPLAGEDA
ncbi:sensor histidine kinase [Chrysiogenes arsenatis]|uniref:sensor histidine kinase n=1 Tax=Chrysiogenes arsenatis TaxID=309797 RepID=UPI0004101452|nr:response regulator [Chrysiogenes arsenatis]